MMIAAFPDGHYVFPDHDTPCKTPAAAIAGPLTTKDAALRWMLAYMVERLTEPERAIWDQVKPAPDESFDVAQFYGAILMLRRGSPLEMMMRYTARLQHTLVFAATPVFPVERTQPLRFTRPK